MDNEDIKKNINEAKENIWKIKEEGYRRAQEQYRKMKDNFQDKREEMKELVRNNPEKAMFVSAGIGFLAGLAISLLIGIKMKK